MNPAQQGPINDERGFTLIEIALVIVLILIVSTIAIGRLDSVVAWKQQGDIRKFADTWEFLFHEAIGHNENFRLVISFADNSYYVRREVVTQGTISRKVDHLSGLRLESEKKRLAEQAEEELPTLEEEYLKEDERQTEVLENLFYDLTFGDPAGPMRLTVPLTYPSLAEKKFLTDGLKFISVKTAQKEINSGEIFIRFSARGASDFAVVKLGVGDNIFTVFMNPSTGSVTVNAGSLDFDWTKNST